MRFSVDIGMHSTKKSRVLMRKAQAKACIFLAVLLAHSACVFALDPSLDVSQYAHSSWKIREGFSRGSIFAIAQTPDGYLWLGTELGLVRFDGVHAIPWQPPDGEQLPDGFVYQLLVSRDGTLWIGTEKGLASWKDGQLTQYPEAAGHAVHLLAQGADGTIWFGVANPGRLCAVRVGSTQCYGDGSFGRSISALYEDHNGNLWVSAETGLWRWRPGPPERYTLPGEAIQAHALVEDKNGVLLMAVSKSNPYSTAVNASIEGLKQLVGGKIRSYPVPLIGEQFKPTRLLRSSDGSMWVGTLHGLLHVYQGRIDRFSANDGLTGDIVTCIFEDREGDVWVSTQEGLDRFREFAVPTISVKQGLSNGAVDVLEGTPDGSIWIATAGELNRWQNGHVTVYGKRSEPGQNRRNDERDPILTARVTEIANSKVGRAISLGQDDRGQLWIGTPEGVYYQDRDRFVRVPGLPNGNIFSIAGDGQGKVSISHNDEGLFYLTQEGPVRRIPWSRFGHGGAAEALLPDRLHSGVWLGFADGGIAYLKDGQIGASYNAADGLGYGWVMDLEAGSDGSVWAGTEGGLSRVKDGSVTTLSSRNGLPCDAVQWVIEDDDHSLWLYMPCGLVRIAQSELDAWAMDSKRNVRTTVFDGSDGVWSRGRPGHFSPRVAKSSDGKIWFAPPDGVSVIDPHHLAFNKLPPPVRVVQLTADGKTYDVSKGMHLPALVRNLTIDYTALSLVVPERVHFRYKLEGQDTDWREVVNYREAQYSNLPPRHYRFRVIACNNSGVWNEEGATLDFVIPPAWYQTNWFRALCAVAFVGVVWALYRVRVQQLRQQEEKFREAVQTMPGLAFVANSDGYRTFVNKGWLEYTGLTVEQASGSGWQAAVHSDEVNRVLDKWRAATSAGEPFDYEMRLRCGSDGEYRWFHTRVVPLRDKRGKVVKWCGLATDIEDRKRAEQLQADLAHTNRVTMLGELAASISHELKQPITATITNARTGQRWLKRDQPNLDEVRLGLERIEKDGARATEIIDRLRSLYKKAGPQRKLVDVNEIICEMVVLLRSEANRVAVSIRTDLAADLPKITADHVQLQQVLMNLMLNGIEAMKDTGGVLTVKSKPEDGRVLISVSDTGVGLPAEKPDKIFDAFYTTKPQGSGMGLAISRSIIESHGGRLWATSNDGRGASFHFALPIAVHSEEAPAAGA